MLQQTALRITPEIASHKSLESRVDDFLRSRQFETCSATYHDVMPAEMQRLLVRRYSFTSLYLRGRADRIAVHRTQPIEFEWEIKTHIQGKYGDLTVEALPMMHHIIKAQMGVKCLYIFEVNGSEGGFWVHELPAIRCAFVPPRPEYKSIRADLIAAAKRLLPEMPILERNVGGTGDPFFIIDKSQIARLIDWRILISELVQ